MTSQKWREQADRYAKFGGHPGISISRATVLMAISQTWTRLAGQMDQLATIEREERS
jgi:hypothetical protein